MKLPELSRKLKEEFSQIGQLTSLLGACELELLRIINCLQQDEVLLEYALRWSFDKRVELLNRLLAARNVPAKFRESLREITSEIKPLMDRRAIMAHNKVVYAADPTTRKYRTAILNARQHLRPDLKPGTVNTLSTVSLDYIAQDLRTALDLNLRLIDLAQQIRKSGGKQSRE